MTLLLLASICCNKNASLKSQYASRIAEKCCAGTSCWRRTLCRWLVEPQEGWRPVSLASMFNRERSYCYFDATLQRCHALSRWLSLRPGMIWEYWGVRMLQLAILLFSGQVDIYQAGSVDSFPPSGTRTLEWQGWRTWTTMNPRTSSCSRERSSSNLSCSYLLIWYKLFTLWLSSC